MKKDLPTRQLEEHLDSLRLAFLRDNLEEYTRRAAKNQWTPLQYLGHLIEGEVGRRRENLVRRRIKAARFPVIKTIEQFDWSWPKKINRQHVQDLFRLQFLEDHANVIFLGGVGLRTALIWLRRNVSMSSGASRGRITESEGIGIPFCRPCSRTTVKTRF